MTPNETNHLLLIEDNPAHARLVTLMLEGTPCEKCRITHSTSLTEAFELLKTVEVDLVLLDLGLPESRGVKTFEIFRAQQPQLPVVVLTSIDDEELALEAIGLGAQDYLGKNEMAGNLCRTIRHTLERFRLARNLREREHQLHSLFNNTIDGLAVINAQGEILSCNPVAKRVLNSIDTAEIAQNIMNDENKPFLKEFLVPGEGTGSVLIYEVVGKQSPWEETPACIVSLRDITLRRRLEKHLHQSQKLEMVGTLAGSIAHDFNNILTIALGHGELAKTLVGDTHPAAESIDLVLDAAHRGSFLIRDLMHLSRPTAQNFCPFNLNDLAAKVDRLIGKTIRSTHQFTISSSTEETIINGSPQQLEQVLLNLIFNARDASPARSNISVKIDSAILTEPQQFMEKQAEPGRYARLQVTDEGPGIEETKVKNIFEPFFTTKEEGKGTGLGLFIVQSIVSAHQGFIRCDSQPGKGTTFEVFIPPAEIDPPAAERWMKYR